MAKYTYQIESFWNEEWWKVISGPKTFLEGYLFAVRDMMKGPRNEYRLLRIDKESGEAKVIEELSAQPEAWLGMVAGWPTPQQYRAAAQRALDSAERVEKQREYNDYLLTVDTTIDSV